MAKVAKRRKQIIEDTQKVASAQECTGLMPALPETDAERAAEAELYAVNDEPPRRG